MLPMKRMFIASSSITYVYGWLKNVINDDWNGKLNSLKCHYIIILSVITFFWRCLTRMYFQVLLELTFFEKKKRKKMYFPRNLLNKNQVIFIQIDKKTVIADRNIRSAYEPKLMCFTLPSFASSSAPSYPLLAAKRRFKRDSTSMTSWKKADHYLRHFDA